MQIDIIGRVTTNTKLPFSHALLPLFEAIINSIHAIQETKREGTILIEIDRESELVPADAHGNTIADIRSFIVTDDGVGFDAKNFTSFETMDTRAKAAQGGKGIGRLLWLKAFRRVEVESEYQDDGVWFRRTFTFLLKQGGIENHTLVKLKGNDHQPKTQVRLLDLIEGYREASPKSLDAISRRIVEHCMEYFLLGGVPKIFIRNSDEQVKTDLRELFDAEFHPRSSTRTVTVGKDTFTLTDVFLKATSETQHKVHFCAHRRVVESIPLTSRIPHLDSQLKDENGESLVYTAYVTGPLLDTRVDAERTGFNIDRRGALELYGNILWEDLVDATVESIRIFLAPHTELAKKQAMERIQRFIDEKEPRYRPLLSHRADALETIPGDINDEKLDLKLHEQLSTWRQKIRTEVNERLAAIPEEASAFDTYRREFRRLLGELQEMAKSDLADYVVQRATVLSFYQKLLGAKDNGHFQREEALHSLFFPRGKTSADIDYDEHNLWVLDERLAYHRYLASDVPFKSQSKAPAAVESLDRPDIVVYNTPIAFTPSEAPFASVVIVEFKRPERDDYEEESSPIRQVLRYIEQIKTGSARRPDGSRIEPIPDVPFYCYVIATLTPRLIADAKEMGYTEAPDRNGFFSYNSNYRAYIEISSYRKVLNDAQKRNQAFFERLQIRIPNM